MTPRDPDLPPLHLAATAALLAGWCGPLVAETRQCEWRPALWDGRRRLLVFVGEDAPTEVLELDPPALAHHALLDLFHQEIRDRVARVVLEAVRGGAPWPHALRSVTPFDLFALALGWGRGFAHEAIFRRYNLDAIDPRRCPDGSRWVDNAALLAVAREVLP